MKQLIILWKYLGHILKILTGLYQREYSEGWDTTVNEILNQLVEAKLEYNDHCGGYLTMVIKDCFDNERLIWVGNKFYCYAHEYAHTGDLDVREYRPKFKTMLRVEDLVEFLKEQHSNEWIKGEH